MIGDRFLHFAKPTSPRHCSRLSLFIGTLDRKMAVSQERANKTLPNGYGSRLLAEIIGLTDLDMILNPNYPPQKLGQYLLSVLRELEKPIDVRIGKNTTQILFIHARSQCFELMTSSRRLNPLRDIPFHLPYDAPEWQTIRPLRIVDMGATDLHFQVYSDYLTYPRLGPTHVIYTLDCMALVAKFVAYYNTRPSTEDRTTRLMQFIHQEIVVPTLLQDSVSLWLRNIYRQQFLSASPLEVHTSTVWDLVNVDTMGSDFSGAMRDVNHLKKDLRSYAISPQTVLSSLLLTTDDQSFSDYYTTLSKTTTTADSQPYIWVSCLKQLAWWEFILMVASFSPDLPEVISLRHQVVRDVRFWTMQRPWQNINNSIPYREMIRARLEGMLSYLNQG